MCFLMFCSVMYSFFLRTDNNWKIEAKEKTPACIIMERIRMKNTPNEISKSDSRILGKQSIRLNPPVYIRESASIVGPKEGEGPLGNLFDIVRFDADALFGGKTWEEAESRLQSEALERALQKAGWQKEDLRYLLAGDLLGQEIASSFGLLPYETPVFGLYGACSTCGLSLTLGAMSIAGGFADRVACVTSSHFASAEKEFRFPLAYGNQRPLSATWTVTGSGAFLLEQGRYWAEIDGEGKHAGQRKGEAEGMLAGQRKEEAEGMPETWRKEDEGLQLCYRARITGMTPGKIVDFGLKDSMNMGACMAPAAASTIEQHLLDFGRTPEDYDRIITGDLGSVGQTVLLDLLKQRGIDISVQHMDCGIEVYDAAEQDTHAGGSGCGCSAVVLSAYILKMLEEGVWKRVLFAPTGALLSKTSFNEGQPVPGICHAVVLESPE